MKNELRNILSGKSKVRFGSAIQTIARYLRESEKTGSETKNSKHFKKQETEQLEHYVSQNNLWIKPVSEVIFK
jgi:hypothetical protein